MDVFYSILKVAPRDLASELKHAMPFWAPEVVWYQLSLYVNKYVRPSSTDRTAIAVYAILLDKTPAETKSSSSGTVSKIIYVKIENFYVYKKKHHFIWSFSLVRVSFPFKNIILPCLVPHI